VFRRFSRAPCGGIKRSYLRDLDQASTHDRKTLQQLGSSALLWRRSVIEMDAIDFAREVQQHPHLMLQRA